MYVQCSQAPEVYNKMPMFIARNTTWHTPIILMLLLRHKEASLVWRGGATSAAAADFLISRHSVLCYFILLWFL